MRVMDHEQKRNIRWTLFLFTLIEAIIKNREELVSRGRSKKKNDF